MDNPHFLNRVEYRVRPVKRYVVTRYEKTDTEAQTVQTKGEYDNKEIAYEVGYALAREEHRRLGWPTGDDRIQYPKIEDVD